MKNHLIVAGMLTALVALSLTPTAPAIPAFTPYTIYGTVYINNVAAAGLTVSIKDMRTSETLTTTTDSEGYYQYDLMNLPSNWQDGDTIRVTATSGGHQDIREVVVYSENASSEVNLYISTSGGGGGGGLISVIIRVVDSSNSAVIAGASVRMFSDYSDQTVVTNSVGEATVGASTGYNTVVISKDGYQTLNRTVNGGSDLVDQVNTFSITPTSTATATNPFATPGFESMFVLIALVGAGAVITYRRW